MLTLMCFRADDLVKRVFSLEFFPRRHSLRILKYDIINSVRRHALDMGSAESKSKLDISQHLFLKYYSFNLFCVAIGDIKSPSTVGLVAKQ
jgi:hypothetical protein